VQRPASRERHARLGNKATGYSDERKSITVMWAAVVAHLRDGTRAAAERRLGAGDTCGRMDTCSGREAAERLLGEARRV
jgi:hypothetical protein